MSSKWARLGLALTVSSTSALATSALGGVAIWACFATSKPLTGGEQSMGMGFGRGALVLVLTFGTVVGVLLSGLFGLLAGAWLARTRYRAECPRWALMGYPLAAIEAAGLMLAFLWYRGGIG